MFVARYLILTVQSGCEPTNRLWFVDLSAIPTHPETGALDFAAFAYKTGTRQLPVVKLIDDFDASWSYVGGEGNQWTLVTNLNAPRCLMINRPLA